MTAYAEPIDPHPLIRPPAIHVSLSAVNQMPVLVACKSILGNHFLHRCTRKQIPTYLFARCRSTGERWCGCRCGVEWCRGWWCSALLTDCSGCRYYHTKSIHPPHLQFTPLTRGCFNAIRHFMQISNVLLSCRQDARPDQGEQQAAAAAEYLPNHISIIPRHP